MKELNKFISDKKTIEYKINDKQIVGNITAKNLLCIMSEAKKDLPEDEMTIKMFEIIFGKDNATYLLENLTVAGIMEISQDITEAMGLQTQAGK